MIKIYKCQINISCKGCQNSHDCKLACLHTGASTSTCYSGQVVRKVLNKSGLKWYIWYKYSSQTLVCKVNRHIALYTITKPTSHCISCTSRKEMSLSVIGTLAMNSGQHCIMSQRFPTRSHRSYFPVSYPHGKGGFHYTTVFLFHSELKNSSTFP